MDQDQNRNPQVPNQGGENDFFNVEVIEDDFLDPASFETLMPQPAEKKKFEVHIDDQDADAFVDPIEDSQPRFNGEIYFSNRRPVKTEEPVRQQPQKKKKSKKRRRRAARSAFAVFLMIVILVTTALSACAISFINDVFALSRSDELVTVTVPSDQTTDQIIDLLSDSGLVHQGWLCKLYYKGIDWLKNFNKKTPPPAPEYLSGVYYVEKNMGLEGYLNEFKELQQSDETVTLTFPEGWTIYQMFDRLEKYGVCSKEKLVGSITGTEFEHDFVSQIPKNPNRTLLLEGYLFPDTYEFFESSDPNSVIRKFLDGFNKKWTDEYAARAKELGLSMDEVITIASIIQREAANTEQMSLISSVIHNRLNHAVSWPTLACDSTANYITTYLSGNVSQADLINFEQMYNTYLIQGLPPGPICNPGEDAIYAALYPDSTDYYYFRHDKYGEIYMARTQAEHDANGNAVLRANSH